MNLPLVGKCLRILGVLHCMLMPVMWAQDMPDVSIEVWGGERPKSIDRYSRRLQVKDTIQRIAVLKQMLSELREEGYLLASIEDWKVDSNHVEVNLYLGNKYQWANLDAGNVDEIVLSKVGYRERLYRSRPFKYREVNHLMEEILSFSEDNGYPFAMVKLDSVGLNDHGISASLNLEKGPYITFDSLEITGTTKTKQKYLSQYLRIIPHKAYNQQRVSHSIKRIEKLGYLDLLNLPYTTFQNSQGKVYFELEDIKANRFDFLLGFFPNESAKGNLLLTGKFDLSLKNLFGSGKDFGINWEKIREETSQFNLNYFHPNLFRSSIDFSMRFNLLRQDSTYINRNFGFDLIYEPGIKHRLKLSTDFESTNLLSTKQFQDLTVLPDFADVDITYYGIGYQYSDLDNQIAPKKGWHAGISSEIGDKRINKNSGLNPELFDSLDLRNIQWRFESHLQRHTKLGQVWVLFTGLSAGLIENENLFLNEMFRVGGLNSLRGFSQNFFFASEYVLSNLELRLFFESNSHLFVFYDQSFLRFELENSEFEDYPLGVGMGLRLQLPQGVFNLVYGLGKYEDQPLSFNLSKIHFGYVSKF